MAWCDSPPGIERWFVGTGASRTLVTAPVYALPALLGELTHPLIVMSVVGLCLASRRGSRRHRSPDTGELFLHLALIFLRRCVLDPFIYSYHHAPFLLALLAGGVAAARAARAHDRLGRGALPPRARGPRPATFNAL